MRFFASLRPLPLLCGAALLGVHSPTLAQTTWYVNAAAASGGTGGSWVSAFNDLQLALTAAQPGDSIWVAAGTYRPSLPTNPADLRTATFALPYQVAIYGGFRGNEATLADRRGWFAQTILSGDIGVAGSSADNCYHVVTLKGTTQFVSALLDGFTVRDGNGIGSGTNSRGAGVLVSVGQGTHAPTLVGRNLIVRDNHCHQGAGIAVFNLGVMVLSKSSILNNSAEDAGGGAFVLTGTFWSTAVRWEGNTAVNSGGALYTTSTSTSMVRLADDVLFANQAGQGGAVYIAGSQFVHGTAQLTNCTLASNSAAVGASIYADTTTTQPAALTVVNSILWQDLPTDPLNVFGAGGTVSITYSCVKGGYVGVGNIAVDPQFVDRVNGDLRLLVVSPCIDAGNTNLVGEDYTDLDADGDYAEPLPLDIRAVRRTSNNPSVPNTGVGTPPIDMGAYEN